MNRLIDALCNARQKAKDDCCGIGEPLVSLPPQYVLCERNAEGPRVYMPMDRLIEVVRVILESTAKPIDEAKAPCVGDAGDERDDYSSDHHGRDSVSEMVDRVASAIAGDGWISCGNERCGCLGAERWECITGRTVKDMARAALEALREPSEAMLGATEEIAVHYDEREYFCSSATAEAVWEAMVNRALKD